MPTPNFTPDQRSAFMLGVLRTIDLVSSKRLPANGLDQWAENVIAWVEDSTAENPALPTLLPMSEG